METRPSYIKLTKEFSEYEAFMKTNNIPHPNKRSADLSDKVREKLSTFKYIIGECNGVPFVAYAYNNEMALQGDYLKATEPSKQFANGVKAFIQSQLLCHDYMHNSTIQ